MTGSLVVSESSMQFLLSEGFDPEIISVGRPFFDIQQEIWNESPEVPPVGYKIYADIVGEMVALEAAFPNIAQLVNVT